MKTMKHIIWMAALALTAATWSACSSEDELTTIEQPAEQPRTFTVTTTLSPRNGGMRSTMTDVGGATGITAEWEVGDQIMVGYENTSNEFVDATATVTAVDPSTKAATITLTLIDPKNTGDIQFYYPRSYWLWTKDANTDQVGTLADINQNFAAITGYGKMTVSDSGVTLPTGITMEPLMCIWKFSFKDGENDITSAITKLVIDFPKMVDMRYEVTPSSQSTIYVAIFAPFGGFSAEPVNIYAQTASGFYRKSAASVTLVGGKTYTSKDLALKKAEVGKVFGADGNIYDNATAATAAGTTAVAMITYVGSENGESAPYNHGLALAMSDANSGNTCQWKTSNTDAGHTKQSGSFTTESGLQYNDATHNSDTYPAFKAAIANNSTALPTGCSAWFLSSGYQWNQMINACKNVLGANNNYTDLRDGFSTRGGSNLQSGLYWSSSEYSDKGAWFFNFSAGQGHWYSHNKGNEDYVRSALAF